MNARFVRCVSFMDHAIWILDRHPSSANPQRMIDDWRS
jgi:hypothetical protein